MEGRARVGSILLRFGSGVLVMVATSYVVRMAGLAGLAGVYVCLLAYGVRASTYVV